MDLLISKILDISFIFEAQNLVESGDLEVDLMKVVIAAEFGPKGLYCSTMIEIIVNFV
ncbi:hypothetical protein [Methanofollis aquaemaris]|uniref:hypothetical protein n=1 Tax=Methanofollis aquaemaris TaxID=126734 RepID=UPI00223FAAD3|nr:hypothetical protein [Methanofollis aquaemaris]